MKIHVYKCKKKVCFFFLICFTIKQAVVMATCGCRQNSNYCLRMALGSILMFFIKEDKLKASYSLNKCI